MVEDDRLEICIKLCVLTECHISAQLDPVTPSTPMRVGDSLSEQQYVCVCVCMHMISNLFCFKDDQMHHAWLKILAEFGLGGNQNV